MLRNKRVFTFIMAFILILGNLTPVYASDITEENSSTITEESIDESIVNDKTKISNETSTEVYVNVSETSIETELDSYEESQKESTLYELDIDENGVLLGFKKGKEPKESITLVIPQEVKTIKERAFLNQDFIESIDFSNVENLVIESHAFQNANIVGNIDFKNVNSIGDYAFANNGITEVTNLYVESIGKYAFSSNEIKSLEVSASEIYENAFEYNYIEEVIIYQKDDSLQLANNLFEQNPLKKVVFDTKDFEIDTNLFANIKRHFDDPVVVEFEKTTQKSKNTTLYVVNPIEVEVSYIEKDTGEKIKDSTIKFFEQADKPYKVDKPKIDGYLFMKDDSYTIENGKVLFNDSKVSIYFEKNQNVEIRISASKQSEYPLNTEITKEDILKDVYIKKVDGEVVPAIDENGEVLEGLILSQDNISNDINAKEIVYTYKESDKETAEKFTFTRSSSAMLKQEIGGGWLYEDFKYDSNNGYILTGLSDLGLQKLKDGNTNLVLPGINPNTGQSLTEVYGFNIPNNSQTGKIEGVDFSKMIELEAIGSHAFSENSIKVLDLSSNKKLVNIKDNAFYHNEMESLALPESLIEIGQYAFYNNELTSLDLENTRVEIIGNFAFDSNKIKDLRLSKFTIKEIGNGVFANNQIESFSFDGSDGSYANLESLDSSIFEFNPIKTLIYRNLPKLTGKIYEDFTSLDTLIVENIPNIKKVQNKTLKNPNIANITLKGLDGLETIGAYLAGYDDKYVGEKNLELGEFPNLKYIEKYAFYNSIFEKLPFRESKLETIGSYAFYKNHFRDLDFTIYPNLKEIGNYAFYSKDDWNRNINLQGLQNLTRIGSYAFANMSSFETEETIELVLKDLPLLKSIDYHAFYGNNISTLTLEKLPKLADINGFEKNKIEILRLKNLPSLNTIGKDAFKSNLLKELYIDLGELTEIGNLAFSGNCLDILEIDAPKLKTIGSEAFYVDSFKEKRQLEVIDLSSLISLKSIGSYAFANNNYKTDSVIEKVIFPVTEDAIKIANSAFHYKDYYIDLSEYEDIKLQIEDSDSFTTSYINTINIVKVKSSENINIEYNKYNFASSFNRKLYLIVEDNDVDKDGNPDLHSKEGLIVNPQNITINHYYINEKGEKISLRQKEITISNNYKYLAPIIDGFVLKGAKEVELGYSNLSPNEDKTIEIEYEKLVPKETSLVTLDVIKESPSSTLLVGKESSSDAIVRIDVSVSGSGADAEIDEAYLDIQFPEHVDLTFLKGIEIKGDDRIKIENIDHTIKQVRVKLTNLKGGTDLHLKAIFKFLPYETPLNFADGVSAILSGTSKKGDEILLYDKSEDYVVKYNAPSFNKITGSEVKTIQDSLNTLEKEYTFSVKNLARKIESYEIIDKLPTYTALENGKEVQKLAVFNQEKNPDWTLYEEDGVTYVKYEGQVSQSISWSQNYYFTDLIKKPSLILDFPNIAYDRYVYNEATFIGHILNPEFDDEDFNITSKVEFKVKKQIEDYRSFNKSISENTIYITPDLKEAKRSYNISYRNNSYYNRYDENGREEKVYDLFDKDITLVDYLDRPNEIQSFYSVKMNRDFTLRLLNTITTNKNVEDYDPSEILYTVDVKADEEFVIPREYKGQVKRLHLDFNDLKLGYHEEISGTITTISKGYEVLKDVKNYRYDYNYAYIFGSLGSEVGEYKIWDSSSGAQLTFEVPTEPKQKVYATKSANKSGTQYGEDIEVNYTVGLNSSYKYSLNDFRQVDIVPKELEILGIQMNTRFKEYGGAYSVELLEDGRTKITFTSKYFTLNSGSNTVATIKARVLPEVKSSTEIKNTTYIDFSNTDVQISYEVKQPLEGNKELSTATSSSITVVKSEATSARKYIRKLDGPWTQSIETSPREDFQYKLFIDDIGKIKKTDIQILDILPYEDDLTIVENQSGNRVSRGSAFRNTFNKINSITLIKDNVRQNILDKFDIYYINDLEGYPTNKNDGLIDEWVESKLSETKGENPYGFVLKLKEGESIESPYGLVIIIDMKAPDVSKEELVNLENKFAVNTYTRKDSNTPVYIEANYVYNYLVPPKRDVKFMKVDQDNNPLADSYFRLEMEGYPNLGAYSNPDGEVIFNDIPYKPFTVYEVKSTPGYKLDLEKYVNDGTVLEQEPEYLHTFVNEKMPDLGKPEYKVVINKTGPNGEKLKNVGFKLTSLSHDYVEEKLTDENGQVTFDKLYNGSYKLEETKSVNKLSLAKEVYFNLFEDNEYVSDKILTLNIENKTYDINLYKIGMNIFEAVKPDTDLYNISGKKLPNVVFEISKYDSDEAHRVTTDENGKIVLTNIEPEVIYSLKEISTVDGYVKNDNPILFKIDKEGNVFNAVAKNDTFEFVPYKNNSLVVPNYLERKKSTVEVIKKDQNGNLLNGAEFTLYREEKGSYEKYETVSTNEKGVARFVDVPYGNYQLKETKAPHGYIGSDVVQKIKVDPYISKAYLFEYVNLQTNLKVVKVEKIQGPYETEAIAKDRLDKIENNEDLFVKDNIIYKKLKGAEFTLYVNGSDVVEPVSVVDENGYTVYQYSKLDTKEKYILRETKSPEGYSPIKDIEISGSQFIDNVSLELLVENKLAYGKLDLLKYSRETGLPLAGVKFGLFTDPESETPKYTTEYTNEKGRVQISDIELGKYYVKEIESPKGYEISQEVRTVEFTENIPTAFVTFYNKANLKDLVLKKIDTTNSPLSNAKFEIYTNENLDEEYLVGTAVSDENGEVRFEALSVYDKYYIKEVEAPEGFAVSNEIYKVEDLQQYNNDEPITVVNRKLVEYKVTKDWKDYEGNIIEAPTDAIEVELYRNGQPTGQKAQIEANNNWTYTFTNLETNDPDTFEEYTYSAKEIYNDKTVEESDKTFIKDNYYKTSYQTSKNATVITNTRIEKPQEERVEYPKDPTEDPTKEPSEKDPQTKVEVTHKDKEIMTNPETSDAGIAIYGFITLVASAGYVFTKKRNTK